MPGTRTSWSLPLAVLGRSCALPLLKDPNTQSITSGYTHTFLISGQSEWQPGYWVIILLMPSHPVGRTSISDCLWYLQSILTEFYRGGLWENIFGSINKKNQYIHLKNNIELLYFILGRAELHWTFSSIPTDGSDIYRYSNGKWVLTMYFVGNIWISEASLSEIEEKSYSCLSDEGIIGYRWQ